MAKFKIIDAVEKPKTQRAGLQLYPWQDLEVGKGFHVPDANPDKPMRGNQLGQTGNQWAKRQGVAARFQSFRYTIDGSDGVFVQRVA
jgi:hypothetical protein